MTVTQTTLGRKTIVLVKEIDRTTGHTLYSCPAHCYSYKTTTEISQYLYDVELKSGTMNFVLEYFTKHPNRAIVLEDKTGDENMNKPCHNYPHISIILGSIFSKLKEAK